MATPDSWMRSLYDLQGEDGYSYILAVLRGFRQGIVYGAKIRFPHALVMTMVFRDGSLQEKFKAIFEATYQHSRNLGCYVTIYKAVSLGLRWLNNKKQHPLQAIIGFISLQSHTRTCLSVAA